MEKKKTFSEINDNTFSTRCIRKHKSKKFRKSKTKMNCEHCGQKTHYYLMADDLSGGFAFMRKRYKCSHCGYKSYSSGIIQ